MSIKKVIGENMGETEPKHDTQDDAFMKAAIAYYEAEDAEANSSDEESAVAKAETPTDIEQS